MDLEQKCATTSRQCALSQHIEVAQSSVQRAVTSLTLIQSFQCLLPGREGGNNCEGVTYEYSMYMSGINRY